MISFQGIKLKTLYRGSDRKYYQFRFEHLSYIPRNDTKSFIHLLVSLTSPRAKTLPIINNDKVSDGWIRIVCWDIGDPLRLLEMHNYFKDLGLKECTNAP